MKRIILITFITLFALQLNARLVYDEWDIIVPFSLTDKYKNIIKTDEIHSLVLPSFNNDSLCRIKNNGKGLNELGNNFAAGFPIDSLISFKKNARLFEIEEGTLWVFTIESLTADGLGIYIKDFDLLPGCYFSVIPGFYPYEFEEPETYIQGDIPERILERGLYESVDNVKMVLEYFEPKGTIQSRDYFINNLTYFYAGGFGQALIKSKEEEKVEAPNTLNSPRR